MRVEDPVRLRVWVAVVPSFGEGQFRWAGHGDVVSQVSGEGDAGVNLFQW